MECKAIQNYLMDYILGQIASRERREEVSRHLAGCPLCRQRAEELQVAWNTLCELDRVRFPRRLSRSVLQKLLREKKPSLKEKLRLGIVPRRVYVPVAAVVIIVSAGVVFFAYYHRLRSHPREGIPVYSASKFQPRPQVSPDVAITFRNYLDGTGVILTKLQQGSYICWEELIREILRNDLQGRANFLVENLELFSSSQKLAVRLRDTFWVLLKNGRGQEEKVIHLPPEVDIPLLLKEIKDYQERM